MLRAALDAVDAGRLVQRAFEDPDIVSPVQRAGAVNVVAAGKAAAAMLNAFAAASSVPMQRILGIGPGVPAVLPEHTRWVTGGHPLPDAGSVAGAAEALVLARRTLPDELLVVLLSGGGSALMALPAHGVTLQDKQDTARRLMAHGADISALNTVRKHLSAIKGGQLAANAAGATLTLAVSDVVGDDVSVIASGPTVPDNTTFSEAIAVLERHGGLDDYPAAVVARLRDGIAGRVPETPSRGDVRLARSDARIIGRQRGAIEGAVAAAAALGYHPHVFSDPVTGEARVAAAAYAARAAQAARHLPRPLCVISSGETTVTVKGTGTGGRNQEFALAAASTVAAAGGDIVLGSLGTDGVDGPTDAAGAMVDTTTLVRATRLGLDADRFLADNNSYAFFDRLGDLIRTGPTNTNVGDLQVMLIA